MRPEAASVSMMNHSLLFWALLLMDGAFGVDVTVSVMKGDSVTLKPQAELPEGYSVKWLLGTARIANMEAEGSPTYPNERFRDRLKLDKQTGSLTITNIATTDFGLYKLLFSGNDEIVKIFNVTVTGEMTPVSEKEGDPVILHTRLILHINDQIKWMFNGQLIPEINEGTNGRLYLDRPSGSLIITKSKITDSGVYQLNMISSSHTVQRDISVTVIVSAQQTPDPGLSSGALAGIVGGVVLLVSAVLAAVVIYQCRTISKLRRDVEKNGTNDPLNDKTVNSDDL